MTRNLKLRIYKILLCLNRSNYGRGRYRITIHNAKCPYLTGISLWAYLRHPVLATHSLRCPDWFYDFRRELNASN